MKGKCDNGWKFVASVSNCGAKMGILGYERNYK